MTKGERNKPGGTLWQVLGRFLTLRPSGRSKGADQRNVNLLHLMHDQVFVFRPGKFQFIYLNKAASDLMGWNESDTQTKTLGDVSRKFDQDELARCTHLLLSGEKAKIAYTVDIRGTPYEVELQLVAQDAATPLVVATARDITERCRVDRAKDEFVATVSHELRSPLTSIKGAMGLILSGATGEISDKSRGMLEIAHRNSDRLVLIINDILDYEKIAAGQMEFDSEDVDIAQLLREAIKANQSYADLYDVRIKAVDMPKGLFVLGDVERLFQVMANLLSNAAKFSHAGGEVRVGVRNIRDRIEIRVQDSGSGIPLADQPAIFERYSQAKGIERRAKGGTGLGLSIVRAIVERHGGIVRFESLEDVGTTFFVELPLKVDATQPEQPVYRSQSA
ncbi:MAG: ATP-binding protein [Sulfitobacter sp.]